MDFKEEISVLLRKFVDQKMSREESARFKGYLKQCETDAEMLRIVSETLNDIILPGDFLQQKFSKGDWPGLHKRQELLETLIKINREKRQTLAQALFKFTDSPYDETLGTSREKWRCWRWIRNLFEITR
ncbi:hypothetical protein QQ020_35180 [Fulvivirgaceae bacterium BMA12]|uniref:Uncharacterized protein n=1 Tax=Agaribacillus aureus TaxID=3051825 RepID=A0ABT8LLR1_9BACT|nr:hypothetical protein [Fulvivirgaceae bacterium BMA12]